MAPPPMRVPEREAKKRVKRTAFQPSQAPIIAKQLHISPSHPFALGDLLIYPGDREKGPPAGYQADQGLHYGDGRLNEGEQEPDPDSGKRDPIGDDPVIQVDKGDHQQGSAKGKKGEEAEGEPEFPKESEREPPCQGFHQGVTPGKLFSTMPASPPEEHVAEQRDIIVGLDGCPAMRAERTGRHNGEILGQAVDAYIEEASYATTQQKNE